MALGIQLIIRNDGISLRSHGGHGAEAKPERAGRKRLAAPV